MAEKADKRIVGSEHSLLTVLYRPKRAQCCCASMTAVGQLRTYTTFNCSPAVRLVFIEELPSTVKFSGRRRRSAGVTGWAAE